MKLLKHFKGEVREGKFKKGRAIYKDGRDYVGEFKEQLFHGKGLLKKEEGQVVYEGQFEKGAYCGQGVLTITKNKKITKMSG